MERLKSNAQLFQNLTFNETAYKKNLEECKISHIEGLVRNNNHQVCRDVLKVRNREDFVSNGKSKIPRILFLYYMNYSPSRFLLSRVLLPSRFMLSLFGCLKILNC